MADFKRIMSCLRRLKFALDRGDQKQIAARLGVRPEKVSLAMNGGVKDVRFLNKLVAACREVLSETAEASFYEN
jgi:hypothetical protein